ncbi:MAG: 3-deoxy-7-phosphoheptulonate synthase [Spirochaetaceae bacterium]
MQRTNDLRIKSLRPLVAPTVLKEEFPVTDASIRTVVESRRAIEDIIHHRDDRLLAVVGPCSIHDPEAALDYAARLQSLRERIQDRIYVVMRVYFEKPRTKLGWRGLILDPYLDGSYDVEEGLRRARKLLLDITGMGLPAGSELLDPIVPQYIDDLLSWASIGARTTESQTHREMASGLSMPVGFKNGTDGDVRTAVNALASSRHPHSFIGTDQAGRTSVLETAGNDSTHIILRGGKDGPNYRGHHIDAACAVLTEAGVAPSLMVDCSHGNSRKSAARQTDVLESVVHQRAEGKREIMGIMLESNIVEGRQPIPDDPSELVYGCSITDPCLGWEATEDILLWAHATLSKVPASA